MRRLSTPGYFFYIVDGARQIICITVISKSTLSRHPPRKVNDYLFDISAISGPIFLKQTAPLFNINYFTSILAVNFIPAAKVVKFQKRPLSHYWTSPLIVFIEVEQGKQFEKRVHSRTYLSPSPGNRKVILIDMYIFALWKLFSQQLNKHYVLGLFVCFLFLFCFVFFYIVFCGGW